jgi:hypothetical protein
VDTKILVTDAALSTGMWGAVLIAHGKVYYSNGVLDVSYRDLSINVAELEAVKLACVSFQLRDRTLRLLRL